MSTPFVWDPESDLLYGVSLSWGGWWPGKDSQFGSTGLPYGTCSLHGSWDSNLYFACPSCTTSAPMKFRIYPALPEVPPVLEVRFADEKRPYACPVCDGRAELPDDFYARLGFATNTGGKVPCRSCDKGIVWR